MVSENYLRRDGILCGVEKTAITLGIVLRVDDGSCVLNAIRFQLEEYNLMD